MVEDIIYEIRHNLHRPNVTLNELWKRYRDEELIHKRPSSQERDNISIRYLLAEFGGETIDETKLRERVKRYRNKRLKGNLTIPEFSKKKKVCNATVNREIALLKRILNLATYEWNLLRKNPLANFKMLKEGKRHRPITPDEWSKLLLLNSHFQVCFLLQLCADSDIYNQKKCIDLQKPNPYLTF